MTDKSKQRAKDYAQKHNISHQAAVNELRKGLRDVLNASEREVEAKLEGVAANNGARIYSKVRFADVANIEGSGLSDRAYRFALQSHLDFVVTDEQRKPLFAVEYDGQGHTSENDALKNDLCEQFDLPLARLTHHHLTLHARGLDTITWLVELEFIARAMEEAQTRGEFPVDEPIDPFTIISWERNNERFPLSFAMALHARIHRLADAKRIPTHAAFHAAWGEKSGRVNAMATLRVAEDRFLAARESIYLHGFGVGPGEVAMELAQARLDPLLSAYLKGNGVTIPASTVYQRLSALAERGEFHGGGWIDSPQDFAIDHCKGADGRLMTRIIPPASLRH